MKYVLILCLITLSTFTSSKPVVQYESLLSNILMVLEDPDNGYDYKLVEVNSVNKDESPERSYVLYSIDAVLKNKNGEHENCSLSIRAFPSNVVLYVITFSCPSGKSYGDRVIV